MMLPTDMALIQDPAFRKYVQLYAKDQVCPTLCKGPGIYVHILLWLHIYMYVCECPRTQYAYPYFNMYTQTFQYALCTRKPSEEPCMCAHLVLICIHTYLYGISKYYYRCAYILVCMCTQYYMPYAYTLTHLRYLTVA